MKKNEFAQIKVLDLKELNSKAKALRGEIANLVLDKNLKKLKDIKVISKKKKELAQVLTVVSQKELLIELERKKEPKAKTVEKERQDLSSPNKK